VGNSTTNRAASADPERAAHLELRGITKAFPGVLANDRVNFDLLRGEVHALLGENGAGKTTLMNVLYGLERPDKGRITLGGRPVTINSPSQAIALGIGMVHQHFMLAPVMTVVENVIIGREITHPSGLLDLRQATRRVRELSETYGLPVDPRAVVGDLPVGVRQRVEIIKALYRQAEILILDEPTAVLTPDESENLFQTMAALAASGKSVIFITHKLKEVMRAAHRITILQAGRVVDTISPEQTDETALAALMVGRTVSLKVDKKPALPGRTVLSVTRLSARGDRGRPAVCGVNFDLCAGEILGLVGVQGNGQSELVEVLSGLRPASGGTIMIDGRDVTRALVRGRGPVVAHIPEERHRYGMVGAYSIADNLVLDTYNQRPFARWGLMRREAIARQAERLAAEYDIRAPSPNTPAGSLSGGNQQRLIVAREFDRAAPLLLAAQPTRGLDVGSMEFIHRRIIEKRDQGQAVLLVSTELDEILALSDRIGVMFKGELVKLVEAKDARREHLGLWMAGGSVDGGAG
jgi:simple sugar transport system ATP-binding protein